MNNITFLPPVLGAVGLIIAFIIFTTVKRYPAGEGKVVEIGEQIHLGAMVFMKREYSMLALFAAVICVLLYFSLGSGTTIAFIVGAVCSASAGYIGMYTATKASMRSADSCVLRRIDYGAYGSIGRIIRFRCFIFNIWIRPTYRTCYTWVWYGRIERGVILTCRWWYFY